MFKYRLPLLLILALIACERDDIAPSTGQQVYVNYPSYVIAGDTTGMEVVDVNVRLAYIPVDSFFIDLNNNSVTNISLITERPNWGNGSFPPRKLLIKGNANLKIRVETFTFDYYAVEDPPVYSFNAGMNKWEEFINTHLRCTPTSQSIFYSTNIRTGYASVAGDTIRSNASWETPNDLNLRVTGGGSNAPQFVHGSDTIFIRYTIDNLPKPKVCGQPIVQSAGHNYIGFSFMDQGKERLGWIELFGGGSDVLIKSYAIAKE